MPPVIAIDAEYILVEPPARASVEKASPTRRAYENVNLGYLRATCVPPRLEESVPGRSSPSRSKVPVVMPSTSGNIFFA